MVGEGTATRGESAGHVVVMSSLCVVMLLSCCPNIYFEAIDSANIGNIRTATLKDLTVDEAFQVFVSCLLEPC